VWGGVCLTGDADGMCRGRTPRYKGFTSSRHGGGVGVVPALIFAFLSFSACDARRGRLTDPGRNTVWVWLAERKEEGERGKWEEVLRLARRQEQSR
jgi:hypothetical protein